MGQAVDITGMKYGKLTAIRPTDKRTKAGTICWLFKCDCGNTKIISMNAVRSGGVKGCGCMNRTHGETKTRLHTIWVNMRMRCKHNYPNYGAKGISVCKEWENYKDFREWALSHGYSDELTIDRIDSNGNYEPSNCRWATYKEQANNISRNRKITINGECHNLREWCRILNNVSVATVYRRVRNGWSYEDALTNPPLRKRQRNKK